MGRTPWPLAEPGLWVERLEPAGPTASRPALFLDRDGTINVDTGYPSHPGEIELRRPVLPVIRAANRAGMPTVIVTNQSGIARAFFGWAAFASVNARLIELLKNESCGISMVLACAYHDKGFAPYNVADHPMRKPNPGMVLLAGEMLGCDLSRSIMVGDKESDMQAGERAGLAEGWLIGKSGSFSGDSGFAVNPLNSRADHEALVGRIDALAAAG
ncbi:MAG: HAD-IIIA family hydrolase [Rhizobiaceae bacterium]|nr:HAD-IIIA family hydrolase [Rhizobiaceae bacterium]